MRDPLLLRTAAHELRQSDFALVVGVENHWNMHITQEFQMVHSVEPLRPPRMARDENQLAFLRPRRAPLEIMLDLGRTIILVSPEETAVEVEARILKIVRVAAEE